jgi:hypothetical protein
MLAAAPWERIASDGRLVYWRRVIRGADARGDIEYLSVSRLGGGWAFSHRGPQRRNARYAAYQIHHMGPIVGTTTAAKRAADRYITTERPCSSCRGVCWWADDAWVCNDCGDEWQPEHGQKFRPPVGVQ